MEASPRAHPAAIWLTHVLWPSRPACPSCLQYKQPRLEIKKDPKGVVTVPGATIVDNISSPRELMDVIEAGLARRRVSSTQVRGCGLRAAGGSMLPARCPCACMAGRASAGRRRGGPWQPRCWLSLSCHTAAPCLNALALPNSCSTPPPACPSCLPVRPQMNRESSRSHLIITICIESTNLQTQNVARGKL